ncbi:MAG: hypothetical protein IJ125_05080, partial [Atopobiaceae bacterium]|nr:hypothetical protein [Atopobiaceae bacterium]
DEFVSGDDISKAVRDASALLYQKSPDHRRAAQILEAALTPLWSTGLYLDNQQVTWRCFSNYAERTLFNRSHLESENSSDAHVTLLPDSHYHAMLILSSCYIALKNYNRARQWADEAHRFAPYDVRPDLMLVRCDEENGDYESAAQRLIDLLERAYEPESIAHIYYRLAFMEYKLDNKELADACYRKCIKQNGGSALIAMFERHQLFGDNEPLDPYMTSDDINQYLDQAGIPLAPVAEVRCAIEEGMRGALDAELFGAARNLSYLLGQLTGDDIIFGIANSIEREPDR